MRIRTVQIVWHEKGPVLSLDFHSGGILATAGADKTIKLWQVSSCENGPPSVQFVADLTGHTRAVNCIRFAPNGEFLASAGDRGELTLWKPNPNAENPKDENYRPWKPSAVLRGHCEDVYDLDWSLDSSALVSGSLEGVSIVWDVLKEKSKIRLSDHHHYVQGVAWDPANRFLVTQGADRACRVYEQPTCTVHSNTNTSVVHSAAQVSDQWALNKTLSKRRIKGENGVSVEHMFHDDTLTSFYRRLDWSPEGSCLVVPCGIHQQDTKCPVQNTAYVYARGKWSSPVLQLASPCDPFVVIRFCPMLFEIDNKGKENGESVDNAAFDLPYKMVFAAATLHGVILYSTTDSVPLAVLGGLHCAEITDLAWARDGTMLAVSSRDGYCSFAMFDKGELGTPLNQQSLPSPAKAWMETLQKERQKDCRKTGRKAIHSHKDTESGPVVNNEVADKAVEVPQFRNVGIGGKRRIVPCPVSDQPVEKVKKKLRRIAPIPESQAMKPTGVKLPDTGTSSKIAGDECKDVPAKRVENAPRSSGGLGVASMGRTTGMFAKLKAMVAQANFNTEDKQNDDGQKE